MKRYMYDFQKNKFILFIILILALLVGCSFQEDIIDGNFARPSLFVDGHLYLNSTMRNTLDISDDFEYYGVIQGAEEDKMTYPKKDLWTTEIMNDEIGFKVYISKDKETVSVFNEKINEYNYYDKYY